MTPQKRGIETRRLYSFEANSKAISKYAQRNRSLRFLLSVADEVWAKHGRKGRGVPAVAFGEGTPHGASVASYCEGFRYIELVEGQRNVVVLVHELTHAMGYGNPHGNGFVRKYFDLLVEFGRCERGALVLEASTFGIRP